MRPKESFNIRKGNGCCLVYDNKVRMPNFVCIIRKDKLYKLSMMLANIDSNDCLIVFFVCAVNFVKILPLFVLQQLKTYADEFEKGLQVVRGWSSHENIAKS